MKLSSNHKKVTDKYLLFVIMTEVLSGEYKIPVIKIEQTN